MTLWEVLAVLAIAWVSGVVFGFGAKGWRPFALQAAVAIAGGSSSVAARPSKPSPGPRPLDFGAEPTFDAAPQLEGLEVSPPPKSGDPDRLTGEHAIRQAQRPEAEDPTTTPTADARVLPASSPSLIIRKAAFNGMAERLTPGPVLKRELLKVALLTSLDAESDESPKAQNPRKARKPKRIAKLGSASGWIQGGIAAALLIAAVIALSYFLLAT